VRVRWKKNTISTISEILLVQIISSLSRKIRGKNVNKINNDDFANFLLIWSPIKSRRGRNFRHNFGHRGDFGRIHNMETEAEWNENPVYNDNKIWSYCNGEQGKFVIRLRCFDLFVDRLCCFCVSSKFLYSCILYLIHFMCVVNCYSK